MSAADPATDSPVPMSLDDSSLYINRELSLLQFHRRVCAQAKDDRVPLLERLRFLTISSAILDEFFEIRVGGLKEQVAFGLAKTGPDGLGAAETLRRVREEVLEFVGEQYRILNEELLPALRDEGIRIFPRSELTDDQRVWVRDYFRRHVHPIITPIGLDPSHPFPRVLNKSLNYVVSLDGKDAFGRKANAAVIQAPRILPRLIAVPEDVFGVPFGFVLLTAVIHESVGEFFPGMKVRGCHQFRLTRNSDLWVDEEEVQDLLHALKGELPRRHYGNAVRLEVSDTCPDEMSRFLERQFELGEDDIYQVDGPVNLHRIEALYDLVDRPELKYEPFLPGLPKHLTERSDLFAVMRDRDVLLHHPYQSFAPVVDLLQQAAGDPYVLAIKMTLYRTGSRSLLAEALVEAAKAGKEVTAVVELRARFDEAANIELASRLQEAGAKVVYGIVGYKAHAKLLLVVRREGERLKRYVHLGTGNYNPKTARAYSDFGLLTSDDEIGADVHSVFQQITSLGRAGELNRLLQTPFDLHDHIVDLIGQEAEAARRGENAQIFAKMNSLVERRVIRALYEAGQAGVDIKLVVRGVCCLRPGVPGVSENIRVRSVVGRFLEHHRVFSFYAGGKWETLCSSADWMPRNFFRRVEVAFPISSKKLRGRVREEGLEVYFRDDAQAWEMRADGSYEACAGRTYSAQEDLLEKMKKHTL